MTFVALVAAVTARFAAQEAAYRARVAGSKTNLEYLMNVGVVVTEDDARDNAYRWSYMAEQSKLAGVSHALYEAAEDYARAFDAVLHALVLDPAYRGETQAEYAERFAATAAALPAKVAEGKKKPCTHKPTAKQPGWWGMGGDDFGCCKCGSRMTVPYKRPGEPTAAAVEAREFIAENLATLKAYVPNFAGRV